MFKTTSVPDDTFIEAWSPPPFAVALFSSWRLSRALMSLHRSNATKKLKDPAPDNWMLVWRKGRRGRPGGGGSRNPRPKFCPLPIPIQVYFYRDRHQRGEVTCTPGPQIYSYVCFYCLKWMPAKMTTVKRFKPCDVALYLNTEI